MKPILMDDSKSLAELSQDQTNGLGRLDCLKAECNEVANGAYTVTLVYPVSGRHFNDLHYGGIIKAKPNDTASLQLFRIKKISKPMNGKIEIQCQHITYDLAKTSVLPFTAIGAQAACAGIKSHLVNAELYPFDLISDSTNNTAQFNLQIPQSFRACLGGVSGSILDLFGGEYEWDNLTVRHHVHRGQDNGVRISYGKNLTDIKQEESIENMYTAVMPYVIQQNSESTTTILGNLQTIIPSDQPRVLNLDLSEYFDQDATITAAAIDERCRAYIEASNLDKPAVSIDVSFVALWQTEQYKNIAPLERVNLFDTVHVNFEPLNIEASARVTEYTYDILKERYISIHLGNVRSTLAKTIAQTQEQITKETERTLGFMETAIKKNTDMMTGVSGGHKYIVRDALGRIQEEYWLDTDSIETAVNIRRENLNGIAYSHNGINGPYVSAWMQDGSFTTELMNTLRIYAAQIIGGIIQDAQENNYWNLDTGEFRLAPGTLIGNQTAAQIAAAASSAALSDFVTATYNPDIEDLQNQIDGNITTWYYTGAPTLANLPASQWATTTDKDNHIGDLYYDKDTGYAYRFMLDNGSYVWTRISDEDISAAMAAASDAQDTADSKRRVFVAAPVPPYDVGDLWVQGENGDILRCTTAKTETGVFNQADWILACKYTDDSALTAFINGDYATDVSNIQTQIDGKAETWYQSSDPSTAWTTADLRSEHTGDLWFKTTDSTTWRWNGTAWVEQTAPQAVFDAIDGKAQIFISTPVPPYSAGDLWFNSATSDIMTCVSSRATGNYAATDWQKRNKYTDDSAVTALNTSLTQAEVFKRLTNNGAIKGIYMQNGQLYINATYLKSGTINALDIIGSKIIFNTFDSDGNSAAITAKNGSYVRGNDKRYGVVFDNKDENNNDTIGSIIMMPKSFAVFSEEEAFIHSDENISFRLYDGNGNNLGIVAIDPSSGIWITEYDSSGNVLASVRLYRNGNLDINSTGNVNVYATNNVNVYNSGKSLSLSSTDISMRNATTNSSIHLSDTDGLAVYINGKGYKNMGFVDDGNGHAVLGK